MCLWIVLAAVFTLCMTRSYLASNVRLENKVIGLKKEREILLEYIVKIEAKNPTKPMYIAMVA